MSTILSFVSPWEFILRYTVIAGMIIMAIGVAMLLLAKKITMVKRGSDLIDKNDKLYVALMYVGIGLILLGMIIAVLPVEATLYKV